MSKSTDPLETQIAELTEKRDALRARLEAIEKDYRQAQLLDADSEERAQQLENAEVLAGIARATADELRRIEDKLAELG